MNENMEVPLAVESGGSPETVPAENTSLLVETTILPLAVKSGESIKSVPKDSTSLVAETTQKIDKAVALDSGGSPDPDPTKSTGSLVETTQKTTLPEVVESVGPLAPVPPESTSSGANVGGSSPIKLSMPEKDVEIPIQGIDIKTGQMIDVAFLGHIKDPALLSFLAPEPEIPKDIPYSTTNFIHFDVPSKQQKQRSNQWLTDPNKHNNDIVQSNVKYSSVRTLLGQKLFE